MKIIKDKLNRLLVPDYLYKNDTIKIREETLSDLTKYLSDIDKDIIDIYSLINDENININTHVFKQIKNELDHLRIEHNKVHKNDFDINSMKKTIKKVVLLAKQIKWREPDELKELIDVLKTNIIISWHKIRLIYDMCFYISDPDNAYKNRAIWPYERHYEQAAKELRTCFSYFQGHQIKFEASHSAIRIDFKTKSKSEKIRSINKSIKAFIRIIEEFLSWELKKVREDIKCRIKGSKNNISINFIRERIYAPANKICEKCGKKCRTLVHYHSYGRDEFLCPECNISYLHNMDP